MLELDKVAHDYGGSRTLHDVSLKLARGEIGSLLGPSGCGKTTLLRCIAGFENISDGEIRVNDDVLSSSSRHLPAHERRVGMVFQDYALLPHLTARQNVLFGLHEMAREGAHEAAAGMLSRVGLSDYAERFPHELSGGQQQRVAIARALAPAPALLLMDEPFSNIDAGMRADLGSELKLLLQSLNTTTLFATHDHSDAFALCDRLAVMNRGELLQWDSAYNVYHQPQNRFVATFVGRGAWLPGNVIADGGLSTELGVIRGEMTQHFSRGTEVEVFLRPDDVVHDDASPLRLQVLRRQFRGSDFLYELALESGVKLLSLVPSHHDHAPGEFLGVRIETEHMVVFRRG